MNFACYDCTAHIEVPISMEYAEECEIYLCRPHAEARVGSIDSRIPRPLVEHDCSDDPCDLHNPYLARGW